MDELITLVQNDYGYDINFTVKDAVGTIVDLTGAAISFICQSDSDNAINFTGSMATVGPLTNGTCKYTVQAANFAIAGSYTAQITLNYTLSTEIISFSGISITVVPKLPQ
jgi:hypothetical protein